MVPKFLSNVLVVLIVGLLVSSGVAQQATTPLSQEIPEQAVTAVSPPAGRGVFGKYRVWLPKGYNDQANAKRTYPALLIDMANGNSHSRFKHVESWVKRNHWICIMPTDVKNDAAEDIGKHYSVIFPDVKSRFRMTPHCGIMTGVSGGSRRATRYGHKHQDIFGGIVNNAAVEGGGAPHCKDKNMMVMVFSGVGDYNLGEIRTAIDYLSPDRCQIRLFDGGHVMGPKPMQKEAMDWIAAGLLTKFGKPEPARDLLDLLNKELESTRSQYRRYLLMTRFVDLFKSQRAFKRDSELKTVADDYKVELKVLSKDKEFKIELKAMAALQNIRDQYAYEFGVLLRVKNEEFHRSLLRSSVNKRKGLPDTIEPLKQSLRMPGLTEVPRQKALAALQQLAEKYPDTEATKESIVDVKALKAIPKHWPKK